MNDLPKNAALGAEAHDSAQKHVTGQALYIDDMPTPEGTLHACLGLADIAHGRLVALDLEAVSAVPGVVDVFTAIDIPGANDISPTGRQDEPVFAAGEISYHGQPVFAVVARTRDTARRAATLARLKTAPAPPITTAGAALEAGMPHVTEPLTLSRGDADGALAATPNRIAGRMCVGGQDHFYLEGHIALALPGEDNTLEVWSSTQHPSEVQHMIAHALSLPSHAVTVKVRRMGGAFGGKETQSNIFAVVAALAARRTGCPVKLRPDRDMDMIMTGKRHDFVMDYELGFDNAGRIEALKANCAARCGFSADLSGPVTDRALFHVDNAYYLPNVHLQSAPLKTHTVSNTAFRGFGGPQGMALGERLITEIATALGQDPLEIRKANLYGGAGRDVTPYHQRIEDNILLRLIDELERDAEYQTRRAAIIADNKDNRLTRRGIALTPVKFGISFTATWMNQAGALVHIYRDGSLMLNHGGTEMGQGLNTKVAQLVADVFGLPLHDVMITATATDKVPNTSPTAASAGTDMNGMAALRAAEAIKKRLAAFAVEQYGAEPVYEGGTVRLDAQPPMPFADFINAAYMGRVQLSATGFYKTPDIHWDRESGRGQPFYYFAYGAAVSEVEVDILTGEYQVARVDILHDVGASLNPAIDMGQIEGGFVQGMGWLTSEELWWDEEGRLRTHAPSTYKIPLASDIPRIFNVRIVDWSRNEKRTVKRSKAVGEPPFMLAISVLEALSMAVASVADYRLCPRLDPPATPEAVLMAVERMRGAE